MGFSQGGQRWRITSLHMVFTRRRTDIVGLHLYRWAFLGKRCFIQAIGTRHGAWRCLVLMLRRGSESLLSRPSFVWIGHGLLPFL